MTGSGQTWVIGRGGMLGRSVSNRLGAISTFDAAPIDWQDENAAELLASEAIRFLESAQDRPWTVIWCAGAGIIGTSGVELGRETAVLHRLLDTIGADETARNGHFFLTSSAGGVYGGTRDIPITEASEPHPLSEYGHNKLAQEALVRAWCERTAGRAVIGRVSNLYGPGQRLSKPQGLVSQTCLAGLTRRPVSIYVSLDTIRDYVFVDDCSRAILRCVERVKSEPARSCVTKILASEMPVSIGAILAQTRRVLGRTPTVVLVPSSQSALQGTALSFRSLVWPDVTALSSTPLPVGVHRTLEDLRRQLQLGILD